MKIRYSFILFASFCLASVAIIGRRDMLAQSPDQDRSLGDVARELRLKTQASTQTPTVSVHSQSAAPSNTSSVVTPPVEVDELKAAVRLMVFRKDFDSLDTMADRLRTSKERFRGGDWKLFIFYVALRELPRSSGATDADWQDHLAFFQNWIKSKPQSITARVSLADAYQQYAWHARGSGPSNTVTKAGWQLYEARQKEAGEVLVEAAALPTKCPEWFMVMQEVALASGAGKAQLRAIFEKAVAFEPEYQYYYQNFGLALLPMWNGKPGETADFAQEIYQKLGSKSGARMYFEIATWPCDDACENFSREQYSWSQIKEGFATIEEQYGVTPEQLNKLAYIAGLYRDKQTAANAFKRIGAGCDYSIWGTRARFDAHRQWAGLPPLAEPKSIEAPISVKQQLVEMLNVAGNAARESKWETSASVLHKVIETAKPYPGTEFELRQAYFNLASNEKQQGHTKEAEDALGQAISAVFEKAGQDSLEFVMTLDQAAAIEEQMNNDSRAETDLRRAISIREHKQATADRQLISEYTNLAELCLRHNRGKEAIALLQTIISKSGVGSSSDVALVWPIDVLGRTYQKQGNYPEAEKQFLRALHIMEERVPKNSVALQTPLSRLVPLYLEMGRIEDSEKIRQRMDTLLTRGAD